MGTLTLAASPMAFSTAFGPRRGSGTRSGTVGARSLPVASLPFRLDDFRLRDA